ncbi:2-oxo-4-hydroxy-4-carboxy-5-ureidoimidazoline decarboxylase [Rhodococcus rhodnii]|uniref:2-oxo-4-hydroxy-4-carboxy-5-ureidoimidazoline decarboxylase n=2 Tax=Rhodococcus rhodnii TaxID=38312 RepID=R7WM21_9NOCA|nr:2-oxo-4-hydroxy-4-carboxy-5-ureidoimidazoline decarboxylase [Rhodococcus rhodnii]EOM76352.1 putative OHCU decarboxylase [Rhodococcus rhodnii LMG 5362]TXG89225.1 2-oxo-4-hydroxy-4-carboxy-5-ureidoimidazoline decarboxylase [Rhodococcus rhodnii]
MNTPHEDSGRSVAAFDAELAAQARSELEAICSSPAWAERITQRRPFRTLETLQAVAERTLRELSESEIDDALAGHPRIGDRADNASSAREQAAVTTAGDDVRARLREGNAEYERRFGHVYLVCASGRSAEELLAILEARLGNDPESERAILRDELAAINRLRIARAFTDDADTTEER